MIKKSDSFYSKMFLFAGLWNLGIGIIGLFFTDFSVTLFFGENTVTSDFLALVMFRLFMVAIIIFGLGYYLVSRALMLNRGIIWLGLISKIILFVIFIYFFFTGKATLIAALALTGDFLWSLLFLLFIRETGDLVKINTIIG